MSDMPRQKTSLDIDKEVEELKGKDPNDLVAMGKLAALVLPNNLGPISVTQDEVRKVWEDCKRAKPFQPPTYFQPRLVEPPISPTVAARWARWITTKGMNTDREMSSTTAGGFSTQQAQREMDARLGKSQEPVMESPDVAAILKQINERLGRLEDVVQTELLDEKHAAETGIQPQEHQPEHPHRTTSGNQPETGSSDSSKRGT